MPLDPTNSSVFQVGPTVLQQMLGDPEFYSEVPLFFYLRGPGLAIADRFQKTFLDTTDLSMLVSLSQALVRTAVQAKEYAPDSLQPLVRYVAKRRGPGIQSVVLHWQDEKGIIQKLQITIAGATDG